MIFNPLLYDLNEKTPTNSDAWTARSMESLSLAPIDLGPVAVRTVGSFWAPDPQHLWTPKDCDTVYNQQKYDKYA